MRRLIGVKKALISVLCPDLDLLVFYVLTWMLVIRISALQLQAYLRDIEGWVPDHCNKANYMNFLVYTIL